MAEPMTVAVVGAGMSGLFLGYHLKRSGIDFTIYEKSDDAGGTWHANTYPGLHVDVATRRYEFPFARNHRWSRRYAPGREIRDYLQDFSRDQGLREHIRFDTEVTHARYTDGRWTLTLGDSGTVNADVVVTATGFLRVPRLPRIAGMESFAGHAFHSSRWDHSVDLTGKRIGVIGTGSSGIQIVSELGRRGHDVTQFIRTPQWIQVKSNPAISAWEKLLLRIPRVAAHLDQKTAELRVETDGSETWRLEPGPEREVMNQRFLADLEREIPDLVLRRRLTPDEPLGCKRIPKSPDYYRVVQQPNVTLVFGDVSEIRPDGVVGDDGTLHPLDVIVYATGFDTHAYMRPMSVVGPDGVTIEQLWRNGVYSYRGVGLPSLPNFFLLNGPFAPVNSLSIPTCLDHEVGFLLRLLAIARDRGVAIAPTSAATDRFRQEVVAALPDTTYSLCDNWYTDRSGTPIIWPFTAGRHADQFAGLDLDDFEMFPVGETSPVTRAAT